MVSLPLSVLVWDSVWVADHLSSSTHLLIPRALETSGAYGDQKEGNWPGTLETLPGMLKGWWRNVLLRGHQAWKEKYRNGRQKVQV